MFTNEFLKMHFAAFVMITWEVKGFCILKNQRLLLAKITRLLENLQLAEQTCGLYNRTCRILVKKFKPCSRRSCFGDLVQESISK